MSQNEIVWPDTKVYKKRVEFFSIAEVEAYDILVSKTRNEADPYFDRSPLCIIGDKYLFAVPEKSRIPLQGYYLDGRTGEIEYRNSEIFIKWGQKKLPLNSYTTSNKIE